MIKRLQNLFIPVAIAALMPACSNAPANNAQSNGNTAPTAVVAQNGTPAITSNGTPNQSPQPVATDPKVVTANANVTQTPSAQTPDAAPKNAPKLIVPVKRINFGLQPKDKTLARTIVIRNGGKSELKIESVEPS